MRRAAPVCCLLMLFRQAAPKQRTERLFWTCQGPDGTKPCPSAWNLSFGILARGRKRQQQEHTSGSRGSFVAAVPIQTKTPGPRTSPGFGPGRDSTAWLRFISSRLPFRWKATATMASTWGTPDMWWSCASARPALGTAPIFFDPPPPTKCIYIYISIIYIYIYIYFYI